MRIKPLFSLLSNGLLFGSIIYCWLSLVPPTRPDGYASNPAYVALVAASFSAPIYMGLVLQRQRRERLERLLLASFLACMPLVYVWASLRSHDYGGTSQEIIGFAVYGAWAFVGYRRSSNLLALGICAHGIAWDTWHHSHATYIEPWYPMDCLLIDIAFAVSIATHSYLRGIARLDSGQAEGSALPTQPPA